MMSLDTSLGTHHVVLCHCYQGLASTSKRKPVRTARVGLGTIYLPREHTSLILKFQPHIIIIVTVRAKISLVHSSDFTKLMIHKNVYPVSSCIQS